MNNLTTIYLVRHAESFDNIGQYKVKSDEFESKLTNNGIKQAKDLTKEFRNTKIDAIYSSDLNRTKQTAEFIAKNKNLNLALTNQIRERNFWHYLMTLSGKSEQELRKDIQKDLSNLSEKEILEYKHTNEMESVEEAAIRLINYLKEILVIHKNQTIMIVSHGNIIRCFLNYIGHAKFHHLPSGSIENTGYVVIETDGNYFKIANTHKVNIQRKGIRTF